MTAEGNPGALASDPTKAFDEVLGHGRLVVPRCRSCGRAFWYPRSACPWCGAVDVDWTRTVTEGAVYARTIVHRGSAPRGGELPYVLALVEVEPGIRLLATIVGDDATASKPGDRVELDVSAADDSPFPQWRVVAVSN